MKNNRILAWMMTGLMAVQFLLFLLSWLVSAAWPDVPVRSLLSSEGIRWFFARFTSNLASPLLVWLLLGAVAWGAVHYSGLDRAVGRPKSLSYQQRYGLQMAGGLCFLAVVVMLLLAVAPHAILTNVTGGLFPSSFSMSIIPSACFVLMLCGLLYGLISGSFKEITSAFASLYRGIADAAPLIVLYIIVCQLYHSVMFIVR